MVVGIHEELEVVPELVGAVVVVAFRLLLRRRNGRAWFLRTHATSGVVFRSRPFRIRPREDAVAFGSRSHAFLPSLDRARGTTSVVRALS